MASLYELGTKRQMILEMADQLDEETLLDTLESIDEAIELKADNTAKLIRSMENNVNEFKEEEKRLKERRTTIENNIKRIKERLEHDLKEAGVNKVIGQTFTIAIQKNPVAVFFEDESFIPKDYYVDQEPKLNKRALLEALKAGVEIPNVELRQSESLRIK